MEFLGEVIAWFGSPENWSGQLGIPNSLATHLWVSAVSLAASIAIGLPIGLLIGHTGRGAFLAISISNVGRAIPSVGMIGIFLPLVLALRLPSGFWATVIALTALGIPPIVTNTYTGLNEVDREVIEAGRGMGMRDLQLLSRVEMPLALPVILAGVRISAVQIVATATLAFLVGGGTVGAIIYRGIQTGDEPEVFGSALLVAVLAILTELAFALLQRAAISPGIQARGAEQIVTRPNF
jgi:osmoprotectant transport system permease protein